MQGRLAAERRQRLAAAMSKAGIDRLVLYGNAWQGDYLRYGSDFGILEGHGIALIGRDGSAALYLDSAAEAERAELEVPELAVHFAADLFRAVGSRLDGAGNERLAAAPRRFLPRWLIDPARRFALEDATALVDNAGRRGAGDGGAPALIGIDGAAGSLLVNPLYE